MRRPEFMHGTEADIVIGHHDAPRISGLPVGYFDRTPWWRYAQRAAIVALAALALILLVASRS